MSAHTNSNNPPAPIPNSSDAVVLPRETSATWAPVPANGKLCPLTGLGHSYFHLKLLKDFRDTFVHVRLGEPRQKRAVTLYFLPSLHRALERMSLHPPSQEKVDRFAEALSTPVPAVWQRPPTNGVCCTFTGLTHGSFYSLLQDAGRGVQVAHLKLNHETRAVRLAFLPSVHGWLVGRARQQANEPQTKLSKSHPKMKTNNKTDT